MAQKLQSATGANWKPPAVPNLSEVERMAMFLALVDCSSAAIIGVERWQNVRPKATSRTIYFGKHKGQKWSEVPMSYLIWLVDTDYKFKGVGKVKRMAREEIKRRGASISRFNARTSKSRRNAPE